MTRIQSNTKNECQSVQNGEAGFTMIELIIVVVLTSILGVFICQIVTSSLNTLITMRTRKERADDAILVLEKISREVREAKEVTVSNTSTLTFEKLISSPSQHVKFILDSGTNNVIRYSASTAAGLGGATGYIVAKNVSVFTSSNTGGMISLDLQLSGGSEWETKVYLRNNGL